MLRVDLQSSSLSAATFQEQSASLELEFHSGAIYRYSDVPAQVYQELLRAESKGRYFNHHIRNRFSYTKFDLARNGATRGSTLHQGPSDLPR